MIFWSSFLKVHAYLLVVNCVFLAFLRTVWIVQYIYPCTAPNAPKEVAKTLQNVTRQLGSFDPGFNYTVNICWPAIIPGAKWILGTKFWKDFLLFAVSRLSTTDSINKMECVFSFGVKSRESFLLSVELLVVIKNSKRQNFKLFAPIKKKEPLISQRYFLRGLWFRKLWILKCRVKPGGEGITETMVHKASVESKPDLGNTLACRLYVA